MSTMQELLGNDFGLDETVKLASDEQGDAELDRIASALGFGKFAEEEKEEEEKDEEEEKKAAEEEEEEEEEEKKASADISLFAQMFPEEDMVLSKTAEEQEKLAAEMTLGARAYDVFAERFDRRIEKIAAELATGGDVAHGPVEDVRTGDKTPEQSLKTNKAGGSDKIDTTPVVDNRLPAKNDAATVGNFEQKHAAVMGAAMRKALLLSQLEG